MTESSTIVTLIYALIGLSGALSLAVFAGGFIMYLVKLGLPDKQRDPGIQVMEWGVALAITAIFLVGALKVLHDWFMIR